jgi:AhpD family alkylhydroperoxidase
MQSGLPAVLADLVYLRVSQINGYAFCIDMHSRELLKEGITVEKLVVVPAWREGKRQKKRSEGSKSEAGYRLRLMHLGDVGLSRFSAVYAI